MTAASSRFGLSLIEHQRLYLSEKLILEPHYHFMATLGAELTFAVRCGANHGKGVGHLIGA